MAVIAVGLKEATINGVVLRLTVGFTVPKPVPLIVIVFGFADRLAWALLITGALPLAAQANPANPKAATATRENNLRHVDVLDVRDVPLP